MDGSLQSGRYPQPGLGRCARYEITDAQRDLLHVPEDQYLPWVLKALSSNAGQQAREARGNTLLVPATVSLGPRWKDFGDVVYEQYGNVRGRLRNGDV